MTGLDLVIYILENDLLDKPVYENGSLIGFMTEEEAASKFNVGTATIRVWVDKELIDGIEIGGKIYIPANATHPISATNRIPGGNDV